MISLARLWPAALALSVCAGLWLHGQSVGRDRCEAAHAAALADARAKVAEAALSVARKEQARLAAESERARLSQELEDAAYADPVSAPACLSPDRVRRIDQR